MGMPYLAEGEHLIWTRLEKKLGMLCSYFPNIYSDLSDNFVTDATDVDHGLSESAGTQ